MGSIINDTLTTMTYHSTRQILTYSTFKIQHRKIKLIFSVFTNVPFPAWIPIDINLEKKTKIALMLQRGT